MLYSNDSDVTSERIGFTILIFPEMWSERKWSLENINNFPSDVRSWADRFGGFCKSFGSETPPHISNADRQEHPGFDDLNQIWYFQILYTLLILTCIFYIHTYIMIPKQTEMKWKIIFIFSRETTKKFMDLVKIWNYMILVKLFEFNLANDSRLS